MGAWLVLVLCHCFEAVRLVRVWDVRPMRYWCELGAES